MADNKKNICVFTAIIGAYETLNEQPEHIRSSADFICFSDVALDDSSTWKVKKINPTFPEDRQRSQRYIKMLQHPILDEYEYSVYIDNSVLLSAPANELIDNFLGDRYDLALSKHSFREWVLDEFQAVSGLAYDEQAVILKQLEAYATYTPEVLREKPYWCGLIARRNGVPAVEQMMRTWFDQVLLHSRRDQLSVNFAIMGAKPRVFAMDIDNNSSDFHSWPHAKGRPPQLTITDMERELKGARAVSALIANISGDRQPPITSDEKSFAVRCKTLQLQAGGNSAGAGGEISFGVAQFEAYSPMSSIGGYLENAPDGETQGGISLKTRPLGSIGSELKERVRINSDGTLTLFPHSSIQPGVPGTLYFDERLGMLITLDGKNWSAFMTTQLAADDKLNGSISRV